MKTKDNLTLTLTSNLYLRMNESVEDTIQPIF